MKNNGFTPLRAIVQYENQRDLIVIEKDDTLEVLKQTIKNLYGINKKANIELWNSVLKSRITSIATIFQDDVIEIKFLDKDTISQVQLLDTQIQLQRNTKETEFISFELKEKQKSICEIYDENTRTTIASENSNLELLKKTIKDPHIPINSLEKSDSDSNFRSIEAEGEETPGNLIDVTELEQTTFEGDRKSLKKQINSWCKVRKFKLVYGSGKSFRSKKGCFQHELVCKYHKKTNCQFYLRFDEKISGNFKLSSDYGNLHTGHNLDVVTKDDINDDIVKSISCFMGSVTTVHELTKIINKIYYTNFDYHTIDYQKRKLEKLKKGCKTNDAENLLAIVLKDNISDINHHNYIGNHNILHNKKHVENHIASDSPYQKDNHDCCDNQIFTFKNSSIDNSSLAKSRSHRDTINNTLPDNSSNESLHILTNSHGENHIISNSNHFDDHNFNAGYNNMGNDGHAHAAYELNEQNELTRFFYFPKSCYNKYMKYNDVIIIDSTFKTNRFNMPMVNFVGLDNQGRNILFGFGLISEENIQNYNWLFKKFCELFQQKPKVIFTDECPIIGNSIENNLSESTHLLCAWHVAKNLRRHFNFLINHKLRKNPNKLEIETNEDKKYLYDMICSLPYCTTTEQFNEKYTNIINNIYLNDNNKKYLQDKYNKKDKWVKAYMMHHFTAGMIATSRVECFHAILKQKIQSKCQLTELLNVVKQIIFDNINKSKIPFIIKKERKLLFKLNIIQYFKAKYTEYASNKFIKIYVDSLNYSVIESKIINDHHNNIWLVTNEEMNKDNALIDCKEVKLNNGKLKCQCFGYTFTGLPCVHAVAIVVKKNIVFEALEVKERWRIDYEDDDKANNTLNVVNDNDQDNDKVDQNFFIELLKERIKNPQIKTSKRNSALQRKNGNLIESKQKSNNPSFKANNNNESKNKSILKRNANTNLYRENTKKLKFDDNFSSKFLFFLDWIILFIVSIFSIFF